MAVKARTGVSVLNPNASVFIPASFSTAEDFSPEWWQLIQSSAAFRDYWLREWYHNQEEEDLEFGMDGLPTEEELLEMELEFEEAEDLEHMQPAATQQAGEEGADELKSNSARDLQLELLMKNRTQTQRGVLSPKGRDKPQKYVNPPRIPAVRIQQPRA
jgi:hypothetical protein